jgi:hypothetical protein
VPDDGVFLLIGGMKALFKNGDSFHGSPLRLILGDMSTMHTLSNDSLRADWQDEVPDGVVLGSDIFAPYRLGEQAMTIKAREQLMISIAYMSLEAANQGLGSCWAGAISPKDAHKVLHLPAGWFVHDFLLLGYPDENPKTRP